MRMDEKRLARLAIETAGAPTPRASLRLLTELRRELDEFERRQVAQALADGASFAAIARDLGLSRQAVHRRFRDVAGEEAPLVASPEVRRVLRYAREEAAAAQAGEPRSEHVLLAVLRASDSGAAAVLHDAGVTPARARTHVDGASPRGSLFRRQHDAGDPGKLLAAPLQIARDRGARRIEVEDLLAAALDDPAGGAARTLRALGADPAAIRDELSRPRAGRVGPTAPG
jgi:ATP-dependent Clp protease ATP-binding subunit ClpA